jgi:UPF0176 protein
MNLLIGIIKNNKLFILHMSNQTINQSDINNFQTLLYYKFMHIDNPDVVMKSHKILCESLNLKGRVLISKEGVNGTVEGTINDTQKYMDTITHNTEFGDITFKKSLSNGKSFPKLQVKTRDEIVTTGLPYHEELGPLTGVTGNYLTAQQLHTLIHSNQEFYILDMRNDYEYKVGHFTNSILPKSLKNFRDLPNILPEIEHLKNKKIVTVCTGGIRCEKASGFLMYHGFSDVSQLKDGIVTYMETYPNEDFLGKLYVFDNRLIMGFNTDAPEHTIIGKCDYCGVSSENLVDYLDENKIRHHGVVCEQCLQNDKIQLD